MNVSKQNERVLFFLVLLITNLFFFNACRDDDSARPAPLISGFAPENGVVGDEVVITGKHFSVTASENTVAFNGVTATISAASSTSLTVLVPETATSGKITVAVGDLSGTSAGDFTVLPPLVISNFTPIEGYTGTEVIITGDHFSTTVSENVVKFNGVTATVSNVSTTSLTVVVPEGDITGKITVTVGNQTATSTDKFTSRYATLVGGLFTSYILKHDHTLWATGSNYSGQFGDNTTVDSSTPRLIMEDVLAVATGGYHALFLKTDHTLWGAGSNAWGQLGDGNIATAVTTPIHIMDGVKAIAAGSSNSLILKDDHSLWVCGRNNNGQLGDGTITNRRTPTHIMDEVKAMASSGTFTLILKTDNTLWATGENEFGQLGDGTTTEVHTPKQVMEGVKAVATGQLHTLILKEDNTLWVTGLNEDGQLGEPTSTQYITTPKQVMTNVSAIVAGAFDSHTLVLKEDNTLWGTGNNYTGQLGTQTDEDLHHFQQIMTGVSGVSAGSLHTFILKEDNTLWATGYNNSGQLGDGTTAPSNTFVQMIF